jgi:Ala-tRNA(Pro) deacylase
MAADTLLSVLAERGIPHEVSHHDDTFTAQEMAAAEHTSGHQVAKPVFLIADGTLRMAVVPASHRLDLAKAALAFGTEDVRLADEHEFDPVFHDCDRGAEPPVGTLYGVATVVDERLDHGIVVFDAGSHDTAISMSLGDYLTLVDGSVADLAGGPA